MRSDLIAAALTLAVGCAAHASAQSLVYTPVNPSFGGNPFNSSHLLSIAEIDRPNPPQGQGGFGLDGESQADAFTRQLESRILSRLSADITEAIFGEGGEPSGVFQFDDVSIAFERLLDGAVLIDIADNSTGAVTSITVPSFLAATP